PQDEPRGAPRGTRTLCAGDEAAGFPRPLPGVTSRPVSAAVDRSEKREAARKRENFSRLGEHLAVAVGYSLSNQLANQFGHARGRVELSARLPWHAVYLDRLGTCLVPVPDHERRILARDIAVQHELDVLPGLTVHDVSSLFLVEPVPIAVTRIIQDLRS